MEVLGWAAAGTAAVSSGAVLVGVVLDQIPALSDKAERAITALRRVRAAWRDSAAPDSVASEEEEGSPRPPARHP
ncbi:hypothetical protein ACGFY6_32380 [Streptomyces sp. NPDC048387]|uniref:hypothetical protein n=1 Tax=Streptomyces sp. NPDC048387 TaxID=3365542 RepID=UPI003715CB57